MTYYQFSISIARPTNDKMQMLSTRFQTFEEAAKALHNVSKATDKIHAASIFQIEKD